jgi:hypothetical protein
MRATILGALVLLAGAVPAARAGSLIDVAVAVAGRDTPLYDAVDGSGRLYFEARAGSGYVLRLANRTHEPLGAVVVVDGLNVVSGEREVIGRGRPGRMYVLGPWDTVEIRGWRTSLEQVRQFTFVDERASYAARSGKANEKMGWVEVAVYRGRYQPAVGTLRRERPMGAADAETRDRSASSAPAAEAPPASVPQAKSDRAYGGVEGGVVGGVVGGYPGTGWGEAAWDPATEVRFDTADHPAERITLRYEYASSLRAMGILPRPRWPHDRLGERERGDGFARPPRW